MPAQPRMRTLGPPFPASWRRCSSSSWERRPPQAPHLGIALRLDGLQPPGDVGSRQLRPQRRPQLRRILFLGPQHLRRAERRVRRGARFTAGQVRLLPLLLSGKGGLQLAGEQEVPPHTSPAGAA
jgi:hypothetical protein